MALTLTEWLAAGASAVFLLLFSLMVIRRFNHRLSNRLNALRESGQSFGTRLEETRSGIESIRTDFGERFSSVEKTFFPEEREKPWRSKPRESRAFSRPEPIDFSRGSARPWSQLMESKSTGKANEGKLSELEKKMDSLLKHYEIPKHEVESKRNPVHESKLLSNAQKLLTLLELEKKANELGGHGEETAPGELVETVEPTRKQKEADVKAIAIELKRHRIITEFDKIVELVSASGKISIGELARRLGMKKETAAEWCQVLEKNGMVSIEYPPFKDPIVHDIPSSADGKEKNGFK